MIIMKSDELYISYFFPPDMHVSGINVFKRIIENKKTVDILHANLNNSSPDLELYSQYINNNISVDVKCNFDWADGIFEFVQKGMNAIEYDYKQIYSRSWLMSNHFLAAEYKFKNPDCFWKAEFSDPLIYDLSNKSKNYKEMIINNEAYIEKINNQIIDYNIKYNCDFDLIENGSSAYFIAEYLVYLFSDEIVFTNKNQREVMLNQFPVDIKKHIFNKTKIQMHSTLPKKYYFIDEINLDLNNDFINMAYFGSDYYGKRHFESLFYAIESLNHKFKNKLKIFLFLNDVSLINNLVKGLKSKELFVVKKPLDYFKFLNAMTQFDILLVNDVITEGNYEINPYLPSKVSDYLQSDSDVWAFCEDKSSLSQINFKYKSQINDFEECLNQLVNILHDRGFIDENYSVSNDYIFNRLTLLNELYESEFRAKTKSKKDYEDILSSNSWKITNVFRKLK